MFLVVGIFGIIKVQTTGNFTDDLPKDQVLYQDLKFLEQNFGGVMPLEVFVDTKKKLGKWISDADFIKINELEYKKNHELLSDNGFKEKLIVTLGSKGCRWNGKEFPVEEVPVKDVSGAGDTFLAGLVRGYLDTNDI